MSMLLGVRSSSRENEGQPIREGIIQQPASFYNGNPSSSIWGNPPTPPLWRETSNANGSASSSSTSVASASSLPSAPTTSTHSAGGIEQQPQQRKWQYPVSKAQGKQTFDADGVDEEEKGATIRRTAGSSHDRVQSYIDEVEPSVTNPVISPFSFGFPPQSTLSVFDRGRSNAFDPSHFPTDGSVEDKGSSRKLLEGDERGFSGDFVGLNAESKNQKSASFRGPALPKEGSSQNFEMPYIVENPVKGNESQIQFQNEQSGTLCPPRVAQLSSTFTFPSLSSTQEPISPKGLWQPVLKSSGTRMDHLSSTGVQCTPEASKGVQSQPPFGQKGEGVFVFGASGVSDSGLRTASSQPKFVTPSVSGAGSRPRNAKLKKQNNSFKGKGPVGFGMGQIGSKMRDLSLSSSGLGSPAEKSVVETAEYPGCLDPGVQLADNPDFEFRRHEPLPPFPPLKPEANFESGPDRSDVQSTQHVVQPSGIFRDEYQSTHELHQEAHKSERKESPLVDQTQCMSQGFHDWCPFPKNNNEGSSRVNERAKAQFYKSEKNEDLHLYKTPNMSEDLDGLAPFLNRNEVSIRGKDRGISKHGELAEDVLSEENIANVIAGIANLQGLGNQEKVVSSVFADAIAKKSMAGSEPVSNTQAKQLPNQGEAVVKDLKSSDGWKFVPNSFVKQQRTASSSVGADARVGESMAGPETTSSSEAKMVPKQSESVAKELNSSDVWKFPPNSVVQPSSGEWMKEEPKLQALLEEFPKLGRFERSLSEQKENQEPLRNIDSKAEEPFVFRASKSISKPASSLRAGQASSGDRFRTDNESGFPLPSSSAKNESLKGDNGKKMEDHPTRGVEERLAENYLQSSLNGLSASTSISSSNARENVGLAADNFVQKQPSSVWFQHKRFSSGSFVGMPIGDSFPGVSSFDAVKQSPSVEVQGTTPIGEFSGPVSSSESSASEGSPIRGDQWPGAEMPYSQSYSFEFRGSNKENRAGVAMRKKKAQRVVANSRRNGKQTLNKVQRNPIPQSGGYTTFLKTTDEEGSPMDFSPALGMDHPEVPAGSSSNDGSLEQPSFMGMYSPPSAGGQEDCREGWEHVVEDPRIEELRAAAAKIVIGNEHWDDISKGERPEFNGLFGQPKKSTGTDTSCKRRSGFEEEQNIATGLEAPWINSQVKRETEIAADLYSQSVLNDEGGSQCKGFIFASSSPPNASSSILRRRARRTQRERGGGLIVDPVKEPISIREGDVLSVTTETGASGRPGLGFVSDGLMADREEFSHGHLGTTDDKVEDRASKSAVGARSNHSFSYDHDAERKFFTKKADSESSFLGQRIDPGMSQSPSAVKSAAAEQVCERWRLRGNEAYANGDFPKAEECYSRGASSVSPNETSQSCIRASMLCYSNRAATRMAVGRMREALADCMRAIVVDPNFLRVRLRAASCHLALGESKAAANMFKECLKLAKESNKPDSKITAESMEGVKKTQQLDEYADRASELLAKGNATDSTAALRLLNEALLVSPYSESLLEMKAEALFSLRRHEDVVQLCEQILPSAERNHGSVANDQQHQDNYFGEPAAGSGNAFFKLWRWRMSAKSLYHLGRLEESLTLLLKHEEMLSAIPSDKFANAESLATVVSIIRDLLRHKAAGNEAFQAGKHAEAVEHYTAALACNGESRPYNAVCFCNRAAASQALGNVADAIADCSRAIALDSNYPKAISRRATLHEMVRDYGQVCHDLRRLITLLESYQQDGKNSLSSRASGLNSNEQDVSQGRDRLAKAEEEMKKGHPVDHYMILGVDFSWSANEIKKAYRKAALKHHPDKAGQFLARGENGDDGSVWKEVGDEVRRDAERLFKMIGEAYAVLSDPAKRLRYDTEEELRKLRVKNGTSSASSSSEVYRSQYEKGGRRQRDRWDAWNGYGPQYQRWQSGPDAAQPDTYARRNNYASSGPKSSGDGGRNTAFDWDDV